MKIVKLITLLVCLIGLFGTVSAQDTPQYEAKQYIVKGDTLNYRILFPKDYDSTKKYPFILFLHGAGERGNDNEKQLMHGSTLFTQPENYDKYRAIVVFPQCPEGSFWSNIDFTKNEDGTRELNFPSKNLLNTPGKMAMDVVKNLVDEKKVDESSMYVMGLSMGGFGTLATIGTYPKTFAAAIPICGGGNTNVAKKYAKNTATWLFHGAKDNVVLPENSRTMYKALQDLNAEVKYTEYPEANHNSWDPAFAESELLPWLFSHKR
ncbi:prolyl oligopeptidase family serine peptidase [Limibacter armeniacum]|uniref:carboxylesterase family protein n=1 Tax=Limibacter armeniacum TaxID=466084 RepID=UPI002FE5C536